MTNRPLFSVGITTYNRPELLRQCVATLLSQDFHDFEIIIGNDYIPIPLTEEMLGVCDPRIRIINYEQNLGEYGNLKALLEAAKGTFFSWQADDDYYDSMFLSHARMAFERFEDLNAVYT